MSIAVRAYQLTLGLLTMALFSSTAVAATVTASSCSSTAVQSAISSANSGDTVRVPAGSCTWSASVTIPAATHITIRGAGIDQTTVTRSGEATIVNLNASASRITGFTFNGGQHVVGGNDVQAADWRFDHNRFIGLGRFHASILVNCGLSATNGRYCRGLVDNNTFEGGASALMVSQASTPSSLHRAWAAPSNLGGPDTVFIEDNTFNCPTCDLSHYVDTNYGGRFVFRFNRIVGMAAEVHSLQGWRATRAWEIYKNTTTNTIGWTAGLIRGGVGVAWGNTMPSSLGSWVLDNVRSFNTGYHYGNCDGTSTADGNTAGSQGWPCRDQIGRGQDVCLSNPSSYTGSAAGWCRQASEPAYFFLNRTGTGITAIDTSGRGLSSALHVRVNRDFYNEVSVFTGEIGVGVGTLANRPATCSAGVAYWVTDQGSWNKRLPPNTSGQLYKCTATNTWTLYYTPYTYPHPLADGSTTTAPAAPSGLIVQ